ncbi:hypothetical protein J2I47_09125 [Fibrella sp. HMF5335]|uniref:Uncharacterized protein n=1 Tax=Fibrella rubiginis TaxID=2817060 RepID=A0A939GGB5_9BACT|nr:hypothetical protein [Fibrella rubiginis]MBO0936704.1 hypothetical protein [Fibrella rubiginis]
MFRYLTLCLAGLCVMRTAGAQNTVGPAGDAVYFTNGSHYNNAQLLEVTANRVKFTVKRGETLINHNYSRDDVLMAFTQEGNFLVMSDISADIPQADQQLKDFLMAPARKAQTDLMIRRVPLEVLRGNISYESNEVVNYQPVAGGAASISKNELLMIFYRDGKHQVLTDPNELAPILASLRPQLTPETPVPPTPVPVIAPAPPTVAVTPPPAPTRPAKPAVSQPTAPPDAVPADTRASLSESEYVTYRAKAVQRVDQFVSYITVITDKSMSNDDKDRAIDEATRLFMPNATIQVTSANKTAPPRTYNVRTYLTRLKLLPYTYTKVAWTEVQYVKELTQAPDGNYYGIITGQQTFEGYGKADNVTYKDVTQKNVRVKLQPYQKQVEGQKELNWQVFLGNVGVGSSQ